ncbi:MAG TPA: CheR family methyltransferase [Steroidobacteraceae bacterium]|nr:CheR family methyltransferase [Steroidobacteraceae bacterium]
MLPAIAALLEAKAGLDATSIGAAAIERAVRERMAASRLTDADAYWPHLCACGDEQQRLIEAVVVSETWFFRNREAFVALGRIVNGGWLAAHPAGRLRILSAACATGEEPYSIAMALLDCGLPSDRFHIDAIDISTRAIAHAQAAVYGRNSFRGADLAFRDRYFERTSGGYRLSSHVREPVRLRSANLFTAGAFSGAECYDIVFCRNVLIYFDRPTQRRATQILVNLMTPDGVMFVGSAESALMTQSGLTSARMPHAFAFRRAPQGPVKVGARVPAATRRSPEPKPAIGARPLRAGAAPPAPAAAQTPQAATADAEAAWMRHARQLADEGRLAEALQLCEQGLRESPRSAQTFYLLGLLHDAAGRTDRAGENYRKALYLDPTHEEALMQLATLLMGEGDEGGAARLLDRARRLRAAAGG